jgi:endonuclease I
MTTMIFTLLIAGIIAGLIQYFVDFKGLPLYEPPRPSSLDGNEKPSDWAVFYNWVKNHWQFFGYLTIGIAGAFLTPLINEMISGGLSGLLEFKEYAKCSLLWKEGQPDCIGPNNWYYLILFGYGIIFGYSSVRIIRSIGSLIIGNISLRQEEQKKKLEEAQKQIDDLKVKLATLTAQQPKPATLEFATQFENTNQLANDYFNEAQNELDKRSYYSNVDTTNSDSLFEKLHQLIENTHKTKLTYQPSLHLYPIVDRYQDGQLKSIYSGKSFSLEAILSMDAQVDKARAEAISNFNSFELSDSEFESKLQELEDSLPYNCEHVVPQSWFNKKEPMRGDIHHLFTCEMKCNSFRSNNPYFDFPDYGSNYAELIRDECGKLEQNKFEPEINKGVVARAVLYFLVRYPGKINAGMGYDLSDIPTLLKWHKDNKITIYEYHRNQIIYKAQGNRNPFIDFPEFADKINFKFAFEIKQFEGNFSDDKDASIETNKISSLESCEENPSPTPWKEWRAAESLKALLKQVNTLAPSRKKDSDGMIGDEAHQSRDSDHNPWVWDKVAKKGVVTALDITNDPTGKCDCQILANSLQVNKDPRVKYVIWNKQIMNSASINGTAAWTWRPYSGSNPHNKHIHISVKCDKESYDSTSKWDVEVS